ncbi:IS3 family transposase [Polaribacter sp.]
MAESFFKILKTKLIYGNKRMSKKQMQLEVFEYLEIRCNKNNSRLNYLTI